MTIVQYEKKRREKSYVALHFILFGIEQIKKRRKKNKYFFLFVAFFTRFKVRKKKKKDDRGKNQHKKKSYCKKQ